MKPNCLECEYFSITWEKEFPRACRMFDFKGKEMPSQVIFNSTGKDCPAFKKKKKSTPASQKSKEWKA